LYPYYLEPLKDAQGEKLHQLLKKPIANKSFKLLLSEVLSSSLFMHLQSKIDIDPTLQSQDEAQF
jgi:hypothetical protein